MSFLEGGRECSKDFFSFFVGKAFRIIPWLPKRVLLVGSQRSEQPKNVNFEPIIRGLENDIF